MVLLSLLLLASGPSPRPDSQPAAAGEVSATRPSAPWLAAEPAGTEGISRTQVSGQCLLVDLRPVLAASAPAVRHRRPRYSAVATLDLQIRATLRRSVALGTRFAFRVFTPQGHLYQTLPAVATVRTAQAGAVGAERLPARWPTATATLLVAGTAIVNNSLYGAWRVEPHIEGDPRPCAAASGFWIGP
jgi:hypothetical protein